jgi:hypothetical protein
MKKKTLKFYNYNNRKIKILGIEKSVTFLVILRLIKLETIFSKNVI